LEAPYPDIFEDPDGDYSPIFLIQHGGCPWTRKVYNARARGARVVVLISDSENFHHEENKDDKLGERIDIPTVIIRKSDGETITDYMKKNTIRKVTMSVKFVSVVEEGQRIEVKLFMRADDPKALHFFKEFKQYYLPLSKCYK
jgi:hypothetical protein